MSDKAPYKTKQMTDILTYLKSVEGRHVNVSDISHYFKENGYTIGTATIYRNLDRMVEQGIVAKYTVDGTTSACFEYLGEHHKEVNLVCYHCKCECCGKLFHVHCEELTALGHHMTEHHNFQIDYKKTVFYGLCGDCSSNV